MKRSYTMTVVSACVVAVLFGATSALAAAGTHASSNEVMELLQQDAKGETLEGPTILKNAQAHVNTSTGQVSFQVKGLSAFDSTATMVKGTLVCKASAGLGATLVNTPVVALTDEGGATFSGHVQLPAACVTAPHDLAFFVRTVATR